MHNKYCHTRPCGKNLWVRVRVAFHLPFLKIIYFWVPIFQDQHFVQNQNLRAFSSVALLSPSLFTNLFSRVWPGFVLAYQVWCGGGGVGLYTPDLSQQELAG